LKYQGDLDLPRLLLLLGRNLLIAISIVLLFLCGRSIP